MKTQDTSSSSVSRTELNERIMEINSLRQELERTKKDKNITTGLVTQMQRDMTSKVRERCILLGFWNEILEFSPLSVDCSCLTNY